MSDPTTELLAEMALHGLNPGTIEWSGKIVRFAGPDDRGTKKDGFYIAYPDAPAGANFGHWKTLPPPGVNWSHKNGRSELYDPAALRKSWEERDRQREAERAAEQDAAAAQARDMWERARALTSPDEHPYLVRKGITSAEGLRLLDGRLLIPMKGFGQGNPIRSLQSINADGQKRFTREAQVLGTRTTIGSGGFKGATSGHPYLYICEGWATGWSIHAATGMAVVVAFMAGNLKPIAEAMRDKYPEAQIVIAADNDRWSEISFEGRRIGNPGAHYARLAAEAVGARIAIPEFVELEDRPTDFNDLHQREGVDAVLACLGAAEAVTPAPTEDKPPAASKPKKAEPPAAPPAPPSAESLEPQLWTSSAPFRLLGYDRGTFYYLPRESGQIVGLSPSAHDRKTLLPLAPLPWWEANFPSKRGADWETAGDALVRASYRAGVFRPERMRGRGCWRDDQGIILHLGDRLLPPKGKAFVDPEDFTCSSRLIYERQPRLNGPDETHALSVTQGQELLDLFNGLLWHEEASGTLAAGWTVLAPICGALRWRPHIWIVGGAGSGKTTIVRDLILPLLGGPPEHGGTARYFEGGSTEAGIRQLLRADALPVLYDEAEKTDLRSDARVQSVLGLARSASSSEGAQTAKGTTHGTAMSFQVRSMFCLASIGGAVRQEADKSRISLLQLKGKGAVPAEERRAHWKSYAPRLAAVNVALGRALFSRTLAWLRDGRLEETLNVFRGAASAHLGDTRAGDQYGTLYAGAWLLKCDVPPDATEAREEIATHGLDDYIAEQAPEGRRALEVLLQQIVRVESTNGPRSLAVGELIDIGTGGLGAVGADEARKALTQRGLRVEMQNGEWVLLVAHGSSWITETLKDTPYSDNVFTALRTLPGVDRGGQVRFHQGLSCKTTVVPLHVLEGAAGTEALAE